MRTADGLYAAPSRKLIDDALSLVGVTGRRPVTMPIEKVRAEHRDAEDPGTAEAQTYRRVVGKLMLIAKDRPDLGSAVKELCRDLKLPSWRSW